MRVSTTPFFSVVVPVYNKEKHLADTIKSILGQTFRNFELVIVLDPSTDKSEDVATSFVDDRIRIFRRQIPGPGGYAARNLGIKHASAPWIAFLDADDTWKLNFLEVVKCEIDIHKNVGVFCAGYTIKRNGMFSPGLYYKKFSGNGNHLFSFDQFLVHKPIWTSVLVVLKERIIACGGFPEGRFSRGGDQDTWFRLMRQERTGYWIADTSAVYNTDADNRVTKIVRFDIASHPLYHSVRKALNAERDSGVRMALMKHWNLTAFSYLKNMAKTECLMFSPFYQYYFWYPRIIDYRVILFFIYSFKNILWKRKN